MENYQVIVFLAFLTPSLVLAITPHQDCFEKARHSVCVSVFIDDLYYCLNESTVSYNHVSLKLAVTFEKKTGQVYVRDACDDYAFALVYAPNRNRNEEVTLDCSMYDMIGIIFGILSFVVTVSSSVVVFCFHRKQKKFLETIHRFQRRELRLSVSTNDSDLEEHVTTSKERKQKRDRPSELSATAAAMIPADATVKDASEKSAKRRVPHFPKTDITRAAEDSENDRKKVILVGEEEWKTLKKLEGEMKKLTEELKEKTAVKVDRQTESEEERSANLDDALFRFNNNPVIKRLERPTEKQREIQKYKTFDRQAERKLEKEFQKARAAERQRELDTENQKERERQFQKDKREREIERQKKQFCWDPKFFSNVPLTKDEEEILACNETDKLPILVEKKGEDTEKCFSTPPEHFI